jgi:hypothetical protein
VFRAPSSPSRVSTNKCFAFLFVTSAKFPHSPVLLTVQQLPLLSPSQHRCPHRRLLFRYHPPLSLPQVLRSKSSAELPRKQVVYEAAYEANHPRCKLSGKQAIRKGKYPRSMLPPKQVIYKITYEESRLRSKLCSK